MEVRYYLSGKKSWSDVTASMNQSQLTKVPSKGAIVNVGKIKMTVKDVIDGTVHGRPVTKVFLEDLDEYTANVCEALDELNINGDLIVLEVEEPVLEARSKVAGNDKRTYSSSILGPSDMGQTLRAAGPGTSFTFGGYVRSGLSGMGQGYGVQVTDFGEVVTANVTYSNAQTGKCASQNFAIIYRGSQSKYVYTVYSSAVRWRHCNDYNQAIAFIRSKASNLPGMTSGTA